MKFYSVNRETIGDWGVRLVLPVCAVFLLTSCWEKLDKLKEFLPQPAPEQSTSGREDKTMDGAGLFDPAKVDEAVPVAPAFEVNKSSFVSLLLYHDFVERIPRNEMTVSVPVFRAQLQALKDAGIPVIPMSDALAWKRGEKNIPDECVVITLDDGWVGEHQLAFPILKEFGYPFTIYLYKKYVNSGGRSMTLAQIKEMLDYGAELGSHSLSHKPLAMEKSKMDAEKYQHWLHDEIYESKKWLEDTFKVPCKTFAYPYGNKNEDIVQMTMDAGYEAAVTVNPQKLTYDTPPGKFPRFTQLGDKDGNFKLATSFHGRNDVSNTNFLKVDAKDEQGHKLLDLQPEPNSTITERRPLIKARLAKLGSIVPDSVGMRVGGFGAVPVEFDESTQTVSFRVPQRLRAEDCSVALTFRRSDSDKDEVVTWKFKIDQKASYTNAGPPPVAVPVKSKKS